MGNPSAVSAFNSTTMGRPEPALTISFIRKEGLYLSAGVVLVSGSVSENKQVLCRHVQTFSKESQI